MHWGDILMSFMWTTRTAEMARDAKRTADEAKTMISAAMIEWRENLKEVKVDLLKEAERRDADQKNWRDGLGRRLDKQDATMLVIAGSVIMLLFAAMGVFIQHYVLK